MKIKSFGCSFIYGNELSDCNNDYNKNYSQQTWPAKLAKTLNRSYECYAQPGIGNLQILEQILNQLNTSNNTELFVIGWTWIDRFDYYKTDCNSRKKTTAWSTIRPTSQSKIAKNYFKMLQSEYKDKLSSVTYIKTAIDALNQNQIPFVMTYMDELMFDQNWNITPGLVYLQGVVKCYMTTFTGLSFLDWSRKHNYPETKNWHPLELAHQAAADYMLTVFDKQNTNDPIQQVRA